MTHQYNKSWLFFYQPVIGTELTLSRMDSVEYWKEDSFFFNKSARLFQDWKLSMMQPSVQYNLTVTVMKF